MTKDTNSEPPKRAIDHMISNLNNKVKLDHLDFVDHGVRPMDDDYHRIKKEFIELWGLEKYEEESLKREAQVEKLYGTDWKTKRIIFED